MPDADGNLRGITVPAEAWERIFGTGMHAHDHDWGQNPPASESNLSGGSEGATFREKRWPQCNRCRRTMVPALALVPVWSCVCGREIPRG